LYHKIFVLDSLVHTLRLILSDYKQVIKNLVFFFSRQMVSTMEDEVIATVSIIFLCAPMKSLKKRKVKRNCWTIPWKKRRNVFGAHLGLLEELRREDPNSYKNCVLHLFCGNSPSLPPDIFHKSSSSSNATTSSI